MSAEEQEAREFVHTHANSCGIEPAPKIVLKRGYLSVLVGGDKGAEGGVGGGGGMGVRRAWRRAWFVLEREGAGLFQLCMFQSLESEAPLLVVPMVGAKVFVP